MLVYNRICVYIVPSTGELAFSLQSIVHCPLGGRVYGYDGGYEGGNLALRLLNDLGIDLDYSMSATYLTKNQHARTKYNDIWFHFVWEILDEGDMELQKIRTKDNPADMLTKVVLRMKFIHCRELLYILPVS